MRARLAAWSSVNRALHGQGPPAHDRGIDHGGLHILVPEQFLNRADIVAGLQQVGGEAVAEGMTAGMLGEACLTDDAGRGTG